MVGKSALVSMFASKEKKVFPKDYIMVRQAQQLCVQLTCTAVTTAACQVASEPMCNSMRRSAIQMCH